MNNVLNRPAEQYLERLARALWPLGSDQRAAIVLEIRSHLAGSAESGRLDEALAGLGAPETLAGHFLDAGAGDGTPPPAPVERGVGLTASQIVGDVRATWRAGRNGLFLVGAVLVTMLISTDFLLWLKALRPAIALDVWPVMLVRVAVLVLALAATYRLLLSERRHVWEIDRTTFAFGGAVAFTLFAAAALALGTAKVGTAALSVAGVEGTALYLARAMLVFAALALAALLLLRVQPWVAGLGAGRRDVGLRRSFEGMRGRMGSVAKGWALLILPLYFLHFALSFAAVKLFPLGATQLLLAGVDGVVSTMIALAAATLNATTFRWVAGEAIPAPRPFSTEPPRPEMVEAARLRLSQLLQAQDALHS